MAKTYIDRAALMAHIETQSREWGEEYDALQILGDIEDFKPADVWPREKVLQAIAVGLAKAGRPIGGRVHQCIYDALLKGEVKT